MIKRCEIVLCIIMLVVLAGMVSARDIQRVDDSLVAKSGHRTIDLKIDIDAARITIETHEGGPLVDYRVRYDADKYDIEVDYDDDGDVGEVTIVQEKRKHRFDYDSDDARWTISLSRDFTYDMDLDIGFAECRTDLSGLPISNLRVDVGAAEGMIEFDQANPEKMESLDIDAGAGEFDFVGLGYANAENYIFDGGAGEFSLDFEGFTEGYHYANIDIGVGEVTIELPEDLPVHIEADEGWFNELNIHGRDFDEVDDGVYETENFDKGNFGLELELDVGMGEATIRRAGTRMYIDNDKGVYGLRLPSGDRIFSLIAPPDIPDVPDLPDIPDIPDLPSIVSIPDIPAVPSAPSMIVIPSIPDIPAIPALPTAPSVIDLSDLSEPGHYIIRPSSGEGGDSRIPD